MLAGLAATACLWTATAFAWLPADRPAVAGILPTLAQEERLRALVGQPVYSADGVRFGDVDAVVVDTDTLQVTGAVIRYGGFLGTFSNGVFIPADQLITVNTDSVVLRWTSADVEAAPEVDDQQLVAVGTLIRAQ